MTVEVALHIWPLDVGEDERARLFELLSADERARASRFVFERDQKRFAVARGRLRELLAEATGVKPASIAFATSAHGKPALVSGDLTFNLSHAGGLAALGIAREHAIGVDIEEVRPLKEDVAGRFFSAREVSALRALPAAEQVGAFYRCWTRKEAIVKAIGDGLSHPLDTFDVTIGLEAKVERFEGERDASLWQLQHFDPAPGFAGAVACRTGGAILRLDRRRS
jgi:4'-phosphopantetheinyl transferase